MMELKDGRYSYKFQDLLGTGSFGNVFKCIDKQDGETYALKIIDKKKLNQYGDYLHMALEREIETQKQATQSQVPFFVGLYDNFEDDKNIYIILEYCDRSLMDFLYKAKINESQSLELIFQVALGLNYLHSVHITHRDIKPENILMKKGVLKIADFGFASNSSQLMTNLGTAPYMSPELFAEGDEAYTHKVDVWALNTCLYKLLTGKLYFWSPNKKILEKQVLEKPFEIPQDFKISKPVQSLLEGGYHKDPSKRLSMQQYVLHPAFQQFHQKYSRFMNPTSLSQQNKMNSMPQQIPHQQPQKEPSFIPQTQKPLFDQQMFKKILNFRNNVLETSFFAEFLIVNGFNKVIAFYLLKNSIQNMSLFILSFKTLERPTFQPFDKYVITQEEFVQFIQTDQGKKIVALMLKDITYLAKRYSELYKSIELSVEDGDQGFKMENLNSLFNLNFQIDKKAVLIYIDKLLKEIKNIPLQHEEKIKLGEFCKNFIHKNFQNPLSLLEQLQKQMNFGSFGCERNDIDSLQKFNLRAILVEEYCGRDFELINLVDFYYRKTDTNAILMFIFITITFPVLFTYVAHVADKYLATGMQDLSEKFHLSPTIAAITLIAFANAAPDVISQFSAAGKSEGALITVGALFGSFIFASTLVVFNVIINSKAKIVLPRLAIYKELAFYLIAVITVCVFGFIGTSGMTFIITYFIIYTIYLTVSIIIEKKTNKKIEGDLEHDLDEENLDDHTNVLSINESRAFEAVIPIEESEISNKKEGFFYEIVEEFNDKEVSPLQNLLLSPLQMAGLFMICYLENPLMKTLIKYLIVAVSFIFTVKVLIIPDIELFTLLIYGLGVGVLCLILEIVKIPQIILDCFYEFLSVFASIGFIKLISGVIIDFITFLAFYFSIDAVILNSILLSAGNTIGDLFGNAALAKAGEGLMGAFGSYSGQIFNNYIGFSVSVFQSYKIKDTRFDIFGLQRDKTQPFPTKHYFLMTVLGFVLFILGYTFINLRMNQFLLTKKFGISLVFIYLVFFSGSMAFGLLSRG